MYNKIEEHTVFTHVSNLSSFNQRKVRKVCLLAGHVDPKKDNKLL